MNLQRDESFSERDRVFFRGMADQFENHFGNAEDTAKAVVNFFCYVVAGVTIQSEMKPPEAYLFIDELLKGCAGKIEEIRVTSK